MELDEHRSAGTQAPARLADEPSVGASRSPWRTCTCVETPWRAAFAIASSTACALESVAQISALDELLGRRARREHPAGRGQQLDVIEADEHGILQRMDWAKGAADAIARYRDGESRLGHASDEAPRQRQLTRLGNAAWAAGLSLLMDGRRNEANEWLRRAAERYRESWQDAPPDSWGRPIGAMKSLLLAGEDAKEAAQWALEAGAAEASSPIGRSAGTLALLVLGRDVEARALASSLRDRDDFPRDVADALATVAAADRAGYLAAIEDVLESFETRTEFLEDIAVADTVLVLQLLAEQRDAAVDLPASPRLPA